MVGFVLTGLKCAIIVNAPPSQRFVKKKKNQINIIIQNVILNTLKN